MPQPPKVDLSTRERILDTAEKLFAKNGFPGVSLRQITSEAQVNLASVNYYFGSKDALIDAILERQIEESVQARLNALNALEKSPQPASLEDILQAYVEPAMRIMSREPALTQLLIARCLGIEFERLPQKGQQHILLLRNRFVDALKRVLPKASEEKLILSLFLAQSVALKIFELRPIDLLFLGDQAKKSNHEMLKGILPYLSEGTKKLCHQDTYSTQA